MMEIIWESYCGILCRPVSVVFLLDIFKAHFPPASPEANDGRMNYFITISPCEMCIIILHIGVRWWYLSSTPKSKLINDLQDDPLIHTYLYRGHTELQLKTVLPYTDVHTLYYIQCIFKFSLCCCCWPQPKPGFGHHSLFPHPRLQMIFPPVKVKDDCMLQMIHYHRGKGQSA